MNVTCSKFCLRNHTHLQDRITLLLKSWRLVIQFDEFSGRTTLGADRHVGPSHILLYFLLFFAHSLVLLCICSPDEGLLWCSSQKKGSGFPNWEVFTKGDFTVFIFSLQKDIIMKEKCLLNVSTNNHCSSHNHCSRSYTSCLSTEKEHVSELCTKIRYRSDTDIRIERRCKIT